jgi:hypothetical protein
VAEGFCAVGFKLVRSDHIRERSVNARPLVIRARS